MKIAVPFWEGKVSPVLDTSTRLLVVDFEGQSEVTRYEVLLSEADLGLRCERIKRSGVEVLICGAVSRDFHRRLEAAQVGVVPWISGQVEEVISAYLDHTLNCKRFLMPGCRWALGCENRGKKRFMKHLKKAMNEPESGNKKPT